MQLARIYVEQDVPRWCWSWLRHLFDSVMSMFDWQMVWGNPHASR